jgi:hypothetical protein
MRLGFGEVNKVMYMGSDNGDVRNVVPSLGIKYFE